MIKRLINLASRLIELIFPKSDVEQLLEILGPEKVADMIPYADISPERDLVPAARDAHAVWPYRHPLAESIIHLVKSGGSRAAAECAGIAAWRYIETHIVALSATLPATPPLADNKKRYILIPIPLSPKRRRERGYNQSEWIAEAIVRYGKMKVNIEVRADILKKTAHTTRQALKNKDERQQTAERNIFQATLPPLRPLPSLDQSSRPTTYIIIDDVITTGSTLAAARDALKVAGAEDVVCLAVGH